MPDSVSRRSVAATASRLLACVKVTVRLFAGLRERAGWSQREIEARPRRRRLARARPRRRAGGPALRRQQGVRAARPRARRRRRGRADPAGLRRRVRAHRRAALARRASSTRCATTRPARSRPSPARRAATRAAATVIHLEYEAYEGMAEAMMAEIADGLKERYERARRSRSTTASAGSSIGETSVVIAVSRRRTAPTRSPRARTRSTR